jgi:hypothetical protein
LKGDATHWLTDPEYAALRHRLESAHAAAEAALVEARRRLRPPRPGTSVLGQRANPRPSRSKCRPKSS